MTLQAPYPYFGGKSRVASLVWDRLGDVQNYCEPFLGSAAVLLARPDSHRWWERTETANDADGFVSNFWRAVQADPDAVAKWADWPVNENDLHARHAWLVARKDSIGPRLEGDPAWYDAQIAGWWVWGLCCWIGSGWCSGIGPWHAVDGELRNDAEPGAGAWRQRTHLGSAGQGIHRQLTHLGSAGQGIHRQLTHLGSAGQGHCAALSEHMADMMQQLADRLRRVRVCSGDWSRVCGPTPTIKLGLTGVFLDPPYSLDEREPDLYRVDGDVVAQVRAWALELGDDPRMRIALCGYEGEHEMPDSWECVAWKASGGYASQGDGSNQNSRRERIWFSPNCLKPDRRQLQLWT